MTSDLVKNGHCCNYLGNLGQKACFAGNLEHTEGNPGNLERPQKFKQEIWSLQKVKQEILDYMCFLTGNSVLTDMNLKYRTLRANRKTEKYSLIQYGIMF